MAKGKKKWWYILSLLVFVIYILAAAVPVPKETILQGRWITSLESDNPVELPGFSAGGVPLLPFRLGGRFGYVADDGKLAVNQIERQLISLSETIWTEYEAYPSAIRIKNPLDEDVLTIENPKGYPLFLDNRIFLVGSEQNSITAIGAAGQELWTHDFPAPITCIDAAGGFVLAGTLDGAVELLNSSGRPVITPFEPGGSRLSVILGCAISRDASRLAVISGIGEQRFLLLERARVDPRPGRAAAAAETYKVAHHEFLSGGFRRPVYISFVDNDSKVAFEREGGLGIFDISSRGGINLALDGEIAVLDNSGEDSYLFVITSQGPGRKRLITIRYPQYIVNDVPFKSDSVFFARRNNRLYLGSDAAMVSFKLEKK